MKPAALLLLSSSVLFSSLLGARPALAQDKAACLDAAGKAQRLRATHKLVEARDQLRVCAAVACPAVVQHDCVTWLGDVETALPTVVVTAKNAAGTDLVEVKVTVDGAALVSRLDGQAVAIDGGVHAFHFETADGALLDQQVVVKEGAKNQSIAVVLTGGATPPAAATPSVPPPPSSGGSSSPLRTVGWVLGGVGVAGIGVGTIFGILALSDKSSAHCVNGVCDPGTLSGMKTTSLVSTVGFVAGSALLAGGAGLVLFAPHGSSDQGPRPPSAIRLMPTFTASGGQLLAAGRF